MKIIREAAHNLPDPAAPNVALQYYRARFYIWKDVIIYTTFFKACLEAIYPGLIRVDRKAFLEAVQSKSFCSLFLFFLS